ncbi:MAG: HNH endonuclease [Desulfobacterales bacterium]|nr:MAG: HNH endonuclease [Desulfobacterales bacterium]
MQLSRIGFNLVFWQDMSGFESVDFLTINSIYLYVSLITGVEQSPIESADIDNCITLCKKCHKWAHSLLLNENNQIPPKKKSFKT